MRKIEEQIVRALRNGTEGQLSQRDEILVQGSVVFYVLWGSPVARYAPKQGTLCLGVAEACYQTVTTKSRINAIAQDFGVPRIVQKKGVWMWTDGVAYVGVRGFAL